MKRFVISTLLLLSILSIDIHAQRAPEFSKPPNNGDVYVVAHRGAHQGIPENSLPAYQKAIDLGADFVEIDVRTTKDGELVSIHNGTVDAYGEGFSGEVAEMTLAEIRALDIGKGIGPEWVGTQVPTLDEVLELCKGKIGIYLDFKEASVAQVLARVKAYDMEDEIIWYANRKHLEELVRLSDTAIPMPDPGSERNLPRLIERFKPSIIAATWRNYSESFVATCHAAGSIVIVDESDPTCWEDAVAWKSDGIQTDHPEELIAWLKARK